MHIRRLLRSTAILLFLLIIAGAAPSAAESIRLPGLFAADDVLAAASRDTTLPTELIIAGMASGTSNVGGLWSLTDQGQSPRAFTDARGKADLHVTGGIGLRSREWLICYGRGTREHYSGNADAAQLWIDLHAAGQTQPRYAPVVNTERIGLSWYGLGRRVRIRAGTVSGQGELFVRALVADDLLQRALVGEVEGDAFAGMLKIRDAGSRVEGRGWSADARLSLAVSERWHALLTAEGLLGDITWTKLPVEDSYLISPGVFTDVDGFIHRIGGASGAAWRETVTLNILPTYRLQLLADTRPALLIGAEYESGDAIQPMLGIAWRRGARQAVDLRLYPADRQVAVGFTGSGWQLRIAGDDWLAGDPSNLQATLAGTLAW
jgi:hypothetical protein